MLFLFHWGMRFFCTSQFELITMFFNNGMEERAHIEQCNMQVEVDFSCEGFSCHTVLFATLSVAANFIKV